MHTLCHQAPKCGERCVQRESENVTLLQRLILLAAHLLYLHTHTNISTTFMFLEDMIFEKKCKRQKDGVKGDYIYTHLCYVENVPHPCHFFFLYGYVVTVCQTTNKFQDRNVYIILYKYMIIMAFMTYYMYLIDM